MKAASPKRPLTETLTETYRQTHPACRAAVFVVALASLVFFAGFTHLTTRSARRSFPESVEKYYLPPTSVLRAASLGYNEALADLVWVKTILYFGERMQTTRQYSHLTRYLDAVIALDPHFRKVYLWAGAVTMYNFNRITNETVKQSIRYLEKGHEMFPKDWEILFALASNYLRELRAESPEQAARYRRIGADYLWKAANIGKGPPYLHSLAAKVWSEQGRWEVAYTRLKKVFASTNDPRVRKSVRQRMAELLLTGSDQVLAVERLAGLAGVATSIGGSGAPLASVVELGFQSRVQDTSKQEVENLAEQHERLKKKWKSSLPYAPLDLFVVLGERREPPLGAAKDTVDLSEEDEKRGEKKDEKRDEKKDDPSH
jgi:tetratricopeptide (TPR) repeat protein